MLRERVGVNPKGVLHRQRAPNFEEIGIIKPNIDRSMLHFSIPIEIVNVYARAISKPKIPLSTEFELVMELKLSFLSKDGTKPWVSPVGNASPNKPPKAP